MMSSSVYLTDLSVCSKLSCVLYGNRLMDVHITVHAAEITACDIQSQQSHYDKNIIQFFLSIDRMCMVFE